MRNKNRKIEEKAAEGARKPIAAAPPSRGTKTSRNGVYLFSIAVFLVGFAVVMALFWSAMSVPLIVVAMAVGFLGLPGAAMVVAMQLLL